MAERRANGEGTIYRRTDKNGEPLRNEWIAQLEVHSKRRKNAFNAKNRFVKDIEKPA